jgi:hypothetical protein
MNNDERLGLGTTSDKLSEIEDCYRSRLLLVKLKLDWFLIVISSDFSYVRTLNSLTEKTDSAVMADGAIAVPD